MPQADTTNRACPVDGSPCWRGRAQMFCPHRGDDGVRECVRRAVGESAVVWLPVAGFFGLYEVSSAGDVRSIDRGGRKGTVLRLQSDGRGRSNVVLCMNGRQYTRKVHRLVADAFLPRPDGKTEVNHKNGVPTDNRVCNLEWSNRSENQRHSICHGLSTPAYGFKMVAQCDLISGEVLRVFNSTREAARNVQGSQGNISEAANGKRVSAKGYRWTFVQQEVTG